MNIQSKINYYLGLSYYDLENYAGENYKIAYTYISSVASDINPNTLLIGAMFTCIAVNGKFSEKEWDFVASFIGGYTYDEAFETINEYYCDDAEQTTRDVVNAMPGDIKEAFINLCILVMCVDGRVDSYESSFLYSLL